MSQELADESRNQGLEYQVEYKGDDGKRHTYLCQQHSVRAR